MKRVTLTVALLAAFLLGRVDWTPTTLTSRTLWQMFAGVPINAAYIPSAIKSVTSIAITTTGTGSQTQTVNVTKANSMLYYNGQHWVTTFVECLAYAQITNGTTVTALSNACGGPWRGTLVEFYGNFVQSEGCGTIALTGVATNTATIPSVVVNKTMSSYLGHTTTGGDTSAVEAQGYAVLTNATTITGTIGGAGTNTNTLGYCFLELK